MYYNPFSETVTTDVSDEELVAQAQHGSWDALEQLIQRHQAWIFNIAVRMVGTREDAEDVTQEVLTKVLTKLSSFQGKSRFRTWLYRIVVNHVLNLKQRVGEMTFSELGEQMILQDNFFVEEVIPNMTVLTRRLSEEEIDAYRAPFREPGEGRRPMLTLLRSLPMNGEPADIAVVVQAYSQWLSQAPVAKLFINAEPGGNLTGSQREYCRTWPNQTEVTVAGIHMLTEDAPDEIGAALAKWHQNI